MTANPTASDWAAERGEKWRDQLTGMEAMLAPVDKPIFDALRLTAPCRIADVGCGGGGATLALAHRAPHGSTVHGYDISPALITAARNRIEPSRQYLAFNLADMATAAPDQPYDRLASRFGIMFFNDPSAAFSNLFRWLLPGGRFAFAAWGPPSRNIWMKVVKETVAQFVELPPPDPDAPGPFRYADATKLTTLLQQAGFTDLAITEWTEPLPLCGGLPAAEAAAFALSAFSSFAEDLSRAGEPTLLAARQALTARLAAYEQNGVVRMTAHVNVFTGTHPG